MVSSVETENLTSLPVLSALLSLLPLALWRR